MNAVGDRRDLVLVAQSFGGFTAPLVCDRLPVDLLVLLTAMAPRPGEAPGQWWENTGYAQARRRQAKQVGVPEDADLMTLFFHEVPLEVAAEAPKHERNQSGTPFERPWPLPAWPDVPTRFLLCRQDRILSGLVALSRPQELADRLEAYRTRR